MKHTKLPWFYEYDNYGNGSFSEWYNIGPSEHNSSDDIDGIGKIDSEIDAQFVIKACNSHYNLLEACKEIYEALKSNDSTKCLLSHFTKLEIAIKKAEG